VKKVLACLVSSLFLVRCVSMVGNVHSAKTLDPGISSLSLSVDGAGIMYSFSDSLQEADSAVFGTPLVVPSATLLPNVNFKMGLVENLEMGVHFVPQLLGLEATLKYRFYHGGGNHLAAAPYFQYYLLKDFSGGAHAIYTRELTDMLHLNMSAYGSYSYMDNIELTSIELVPSKRFFTVGGIFGPQICGESVFFIPAFEYSIILPLGENNTFMHIQNFRGSLTFGWYIGKSKKQLDRMERKIDEINEKLDKK
jgi:hypothetical protein